MSSTSLIASVLKSAADDFRLQVLSVLKEASFGVQELARIFNVSQPAMSHHLKLLLKSGFVERRREGNSIFYRRSLPQKDAADYMLKQAVFGMVDASQLDAKVAEEIREIFQNRAHRSQDYFQKNAADFFEQQKKITSTTEYMKALLDVLANDKPDHVGEVLEVGPGDGELLKELISMNYSVMAVDSSNEMLARTKSCLSKQQLSKVRFVESDLADISHSKKFDLICMNMVLHHMPSPEKTFDDIAKLISDSGVLVLADLCQHDQEWAKEMCGDLWLGFSPEELSDYAIKSGFKKGVSSFVGLKNGFQIQLRTFLKY